MDVEHFRGLVKVGPQFHPRASAEEKEQAVTWALTEEKGRVSEVAKRLGVDRNTVRKWRNASVRPGLPLRRG